jgi:cell division protein FtsB
MKIKNLFQIGLLSAFLLVGSCSDDYDGRFDKLEQQIQDLLAQTAGGAQLAASITSLQSQVTALSAAVGTNNTGLTTSLTALQTKINALQAELGVLAANQTSSSANQALSATALAASIAGLNADVDALKLDLTALLENSNVVNGNLLINDAATLAVAKGFGTKVSIITGSLSVNVTTLTAVEVNEVSSLFKVVFGDVTVKSNKTLDLKALASVGGDLELDIEGNYEFPNLVSVSGLAGVTVKDYEDTLLVDFEKLATAVTFDDGVGTVGVLIFSEATSVKLNAGGITSVTADKATVVQLWAANNKADLFISAVEDASVITIAGTLLDGTTGKALDVNGSDTSVLNAAAVTKVSTLAVDALTVNFAALAEATGAIALTYTNPVEFPALVSSTTTISAPAAVSFSAPKLVASADITLAAATTVSVESIATANLIEKGVVKNLTLSNQNVVFTTAGLIKLEAFSSNGKTSASDVTVADDNALLVSAAFTGKHGDVIVGVGTGLAKLVTLTTEGTIADLTINNTTLLATPILNHTEDAAAGAKLTVTNNPKLTSFTTKINRVTTFVVTGNLLLASFDASSMVSLPVNTTSASVYIITVTGNGVVGTSAATATGLKGAYVAAVAATASSPATAEEFKQNSLLTLKPYLTVLYTAALATTATADKAASKVTVDYLKPGASAANANVVQAAIANSGALDAAGQTANGNIIAE